MLFNTKRKLQSGLLKPPILTTLLLNQFVQDACTVYRNTLLVYIERLRYLKVICCMCYGNKLVRRAPQECKPPYAFLIFFKIVFEAFMGLVTHKKE